MRAFCCHGKHDIRCNTVPDPTIEDRRDAIVKASTWANCGSDLHLCDGLMPGMEHGDVMGHDRGQHAREGAAGTDGMSRCYFWRYPADKMAGSGPVRRGAWNRMHRVHLIRGSTASSKLKPSYGSRMPARAPPRYRVCGEALALGQAGSLPQ